MSTYYQDVISHYVSVWHSAPAVRRVMRGRVKELPRSFRVLEFSPTRSRGFWTYATCCMSEEADAEPLELHLLSPIQYQAHVDLLAAVCHYHRTGCRLGLGHTVNFGIPWLDGSECEYALISLPYLDGPVLEWQTSSTPGRAGRFLWLLPITLAEREYKMSFGLEALEQRFDEVEVDYLNPSRQSVV
jgi:hypothetical protein